MESTGEEHAPYKGDESGTLMGARGPLLLAEGHAKQDEVPAHVGNEHPGQIQEHVRIHETARGGEDDGEDSRTRQVGIR